VTGSFPEKVLHDGSPAGTAPLVWTSATVLLALGALASAG
jgi:GH15 family glucan-1,4-alpha-glucosidase